MKHVGWTPRRLVLASARRLAAPLGVESSRLWFDLKMVKMETDRIVKLVRFCHETTAAAVLEPVLTDRRRRTNVFSSNTSDVETVSLVTTLLLSGRATNGGVWMQV